MAIFITTAVIETALTLFRVITRSNQAKVTSIVRIGVFLVFVLLAAAGIVEWDLRYTLIGALLLALAVSGGLNLMRVKPGPEPLKPARLALKAAGMTALLFAAALPAILFPQSRPLDPSGAYRVASAAYTYTDNARLETYSDAGEHRQLNVAFWYPDQGQGRFPLVVFSHGSFGVKTSNESLYRELASHGYVVASIDHTYQCFFTTGADGRTIWMDMGYLREVQAEDAKTDRQQSHAYYQKWMGIRMGDINFVIDRILAETRGMSAEPVYALVDPAKIGVMGHSLGGSAALGMGRARDDIGAVIALEAPFMHDIAGVEADEFVWTAEPYPVPVLNIYSDASWPHLSAWPQYARNAELLREPPADAFSVHVEGVGHLALTDFGLTSPILTRILDGKKPTVSIESALGSINRLSLGFFDRYLKGVGEFSPDARE